jgi:hypothetical protein
MTRSLSDSWRKSRQMCRAPEHVCFGCGQMTTDPSMICNSCYGAPSVATGGGGMRGQIRREVREKGGKHAANTGR